MVVTLDEEGRAHFEIICLLSGADRPCAPHYEHEWPDDTTCRCDGDDCACREGEHDCCYGDFPYIPDMGPGCRQMPRDECWFVMAMRNQGAEQFDFGRDLFSARFSVNLSGSSWDDPTIITPSKEKDMEDTEDTGFPVGTNDAGAVGSLTGEVVRMGSKLVDTALVEFVDAANERREASMEMTDDERWEAIIADSSHLAQKWGVDQMATVFAGLCGKTLIDPDSGAFAIAQKRQRQIDVHGYTIEHDRGHDIADLFDAAEVFLREARRLSGVGEHVTGATWPWSDPWKMPETAPESLADAGAMIAAILEQAMYPMRMTVIPDDGVDGGPWVSDQVDETIVEGGD